MIPPIKVTPAKRIHVDSGDVFHIMRNDNPLYDKFGEVYVSTVNPGCIKGWKKHSRMTLNIVVPSGAIKFVAFDTRNSSETYGKIFEIILSPDNYQVLTIPPGVWLAFQCKGKEPGILVNFADIPHDPIEAVTLGLENNEIAYEWD